MSKKSNKTLRDLTWADLEEWAGTKILSRGISYQKSGYVKDLAITVDGSVIAWVRGSENYVIKISLERNRFSSVCTCPYDGTCKHAVAVILEYLVRLKDNMAVPLADDQDERFLLLEDEEFAWEDDDDCIDYDEKKCDELIEEAEHALKGIDASLKKKSKRELETNLSSILKKHPELTKETTFTPRLAVKKGCEALVKAVTKAIIITSREPGWRNYWKHTGHTPDYSSIRKGFQQLLDQECADDVVRLGEKLFTRGIEQVEQSHDEGETADEIANTMPYVFKALAQCSLPDVEKLECAIDFGLRDQYGLTRGFDEFLNKKFGKRIWSDLADRLLVKLRNWKPERPEDTFFRPYGRDNLSNEVIRALENASRAEEVLELCLREAELTGSYERLVRKLRSAGRIKEAEEWIRKGVKATENKYPGIASSLKNALMDIRQRKKDWPFVAALRAEEFFAVPGLKTFQNLQKACEKTNVWDAIRKASFSYLETGACPVGKFGWPLPDTGFVKPEKSRREKPPFTDVLIDIAISEKRVDEVWHWHEFARQRKDTWFGVHRNDDVATAIAHRYPDRAVRIWKDIAEGLIAETNVGAYKEAAAYLKKVGKTLDESGKSTEWAPYLAKLTEKNKRKTRLIQILNVLTRKPILSK